LMYLQHFTSIDGVSESDVTNFAGAVKLADYCPYVQVCVLGFYIHLACQNGFFLSHLVHQGLQFIYFIFSTIQV